MAVAAPARAPLALTLTPRERLELTVEQRARPCRFLVIAVGILIWFTADEGGFWAPPTFRPRWPCWRC